MIKTVIRTDSDMVIVFDENGEELPEYQGYYHEVKDRILANASKDSVFKHWFGYVLRPEKVSPQRWGKDNIPKKVDIFTSCAIDK